MASSSSPPWRIKPMKLAPVRAVREERIKSSADSISILPALAGRDAVAMRPSGWPVLKEKGSATAGVPSPSTNAKIESEHVIGRITILLSRTCESTNRHTATEVPGELNALPTLIGGDPALVTKFLENPRKKSGDQA